MSALDGGVRLAEWRVLLLKLLKLLLMWLFRAVVVVADVVVVGAPVGDVAGVLRHFNLFQY